MTFINASFFGDGLSGRLFFIPSFIDKYLSLYPVRFIYKDYTFLFHCDRKLLNQ